MRIKRARGRILLSSAVCLALSGCKPKPGNGDAGSTAPAAKIYSTDDVSQALKEANVAPGGTRQDAQAFFAAHSEYQICQDHESFTVAVVRNTKVDRHADDIYVITNYERDGKIGGMEVGPPQFSVSNPASYCK